MNDLVRVGFYAAGNEQVSPEFRSVLTQYGKLVQHDRYGEVWVPTVTPEGWHPYAPCHWVKTKKFGWYYDDKTPWGQIVHHYGRWFYDQQIGISTHSNRSELAFLHKQLRICCCRRAYDRCI